MRAIARVLLTSTLIVAAATALWRYRSGPKEAAGPAARGIPVTAATTVSADVPIILRGLGSVVAFNTVNVQARVVGSIVKINFREGQAVRQGDTLVEIDPRPYQVALDQAKATLARDQATLASARKDLARYAKLQNQNFISQQQYTQTQSTVDADEATIKMDEAAIGAAKLNFDYSFVKSPIDGVTGIRQVDVGNLVQANAQTLVVVTQLEPIYVIFTLPESDALRVRTAMRGGTLPVLAYDSADEKEMAQGALDLIDNQIDQTTGTVKLKARFANSDRHLWPGQFVNAHLVVDTMRNAVTAPSVAIQAGPDGNYAYVIGKDDAVEMRPVKVTQSERDRSLIASGLQAGERIVTSGYSLLAPGMRVEVKEAPLAAPRETSDRRP